MIVFFFTLNFNYVEGDDASTVLYHLCGRNTDIQLPYAAYNSGIDFVIQLSGLKTEESIRTFAVLISFISGLFVLIGCKSFVEAFFESNKQVDSKSRIIFYLLLPFIVPDVLFHSLIVNATNISFVFILYSLISFIKFLRSDKNFWLLLSIVLFAIAIPFRWTMLVVLPVYVGLLFYFVPMTNSKPTFLLLLKVMIAAVFGLLLAIFLISLTGYSLQGIYDSILSTTGYLSQTDFSVLSVLASGSAFLTPPLLILLLFSLFKTTAMFKKQSKPAYSLAVLVLLSASPFFLFGFFPSYKFLITLFPILLILMVLGIDYLMKKKVLFALFISSILAIWFLGIQINAGGTFCGPGFELNTQKVQNLNNPNSKEAQNVDERVKIKGVSLKLASGFYMPMLEGPRPLYGYFYVFCNGWFNQVEALKNERREIVKLLLDDKNAILIQDRKTAYLSCDLYQKGYKTTTNFIDAKSYLYRDFVKENDTIKLMVAPDNVSKVEWISNFPVEKGKKVIFRSSYSSEILQLYNAKKGNVKIIGPFTAIIQ